MKTLKLLTFFFVACVSYVTAATGASITATAGKVPPYESVSRVEEILFNPQTGAPREMFKGDDLSKTLVLVDIDGTLIKSGTNALMSPDTAKFLEMIVRKGAKVHLFSARPEERRVKTIEELGQLGIYGAPAAPSTSAQRTTSAAPNTGAPLPIHYLSLIMAGSLPMPQKSQGVNKGGSKGECLLKNPDIFIGIDHACHIDDFNYQLLSVTEAFKTQPQIQFTPFYMGLPHQPELPADLFDIEDFTQIYGNVGLAGTQEERKFTIEAGATFKFKKDGKDYVCKKVAPQEVIADSLFRVLGLPVFPSVVYRLATMKNIPLGDRYGFLRVTPFAPGDRLGKTPSPEDTQHIRQHFIANVLLRNIGVAKGGAKMWKTADGPFYYLCSDELMGAALSPELATQLDSRSVVPDMNLLRGIDVGGVRGFPHGKTFFQNITSEEICTQINLALSRKDLFFDTYDRFVRHVGGSNTTTDQMRMDLLMRLESLRCYKRDLLEREALTKALQ
ncbi:DUF2608 domain-containing protein [Alphaproteobacteria bacterium]|nr:DUF2608 domain-containing protein [Alphaproteobacteria bacterium]